MGSQGGEIYKTITAAEHLRQRLQTGEFILAPGVYDGFSARIALEVGFDALYMVSLVCILHQMNWLTFIDGGRSHGISPWMRRFGDRDTERYATKRRNDCQFVTLYTSHR
jgi:hypothetical protein